MSQCPSVHTYVQVAGAKSSHARVSDTCIRTIQDNTHEKQHVPMLLRTHMRLCCVYRPSRLGAESRKGRPGETQLSRGESHRGQSHRGPSQLTRRQASAAHRLTCGEGQGRTRTKPARTKPSRTKPAHTRTKPAPLTG